MLLSYNLILKLDRYFPLTGFGETCSDISLYSIVDEDECIRVAAEHFGFTYSGNENTSNYPAGCYIYGVTSKTAYFNKHKSGSANPNTVEICNQGIFIIFLY